MGIFSHPMSGRLAPGDVLPTTAIAALLQLAFFGPPIHSAAATAAGVGGASAEASTLIFESASSGRTYAAGGGRRAFVVPRSSRVGAVRLRLADPAEGIMAIVASSRDGRHGYEAGVYDKGGTLTAVIRRVHEGELVDEDAGGGGEFNVPAGASDTPSAGFVSVDVSAALTAGTPYTLEVRLTATAVELRLDGADAVTCGHVVSPAPTYNPAVSAAFDPALAGTFEELMALGCSVPDGGGRVIELRLFDLAGQRSGRADVLVAVCGGNVYATDELQQVGANAVGDTGLVPIRELASKAYMIGGGRARVFDPVTSTVSPWTPTAGTLPGQTTAGTTTARVLGTLGLRLALAAADEDPHNIWFTAVDDPLDLDTGSDLAGRAYTLGGTRPLKIGQPVVALQELGSSVLCVACTGSMQLVMGDPALGAFDTRRLLDDTGGTGLNSMCQVNDGLAVAHTTQGMVQISAGGGAQNFSALTLAGPLLLPRGETGRIVTVARDPSNLWLHVLLAKPGEPGVTHFIYDESVGGYAAGRGGWFPVEYPKDQQPTCAVLHEGELIFGCADGYLRVLDEASSADDGVAVSSQLTVLLSAGDLAGDTTASGVAVQLAGGSGPARLELHGARTAEEAFAGPRRVLAVSTVTPYRVEPTAGRVRAPSIAAVLRDVAGSCFKVRAVSAPSAAGRRRTDSGR